MDLLPAAAVFASREMAFVVGTHFGRKAGNIVTPACQNLANDRINALLTHGGRERIRQTRPGTEVRFQSCRSSAATNSGGGTSLKYDRFQSFGLGRQQHAVLKQAAA